MHADHNYDDGEIISLGNRKTHSGCIQPKSFGSANMPRDYSFGHHPLEQTWQTRTKSLEQSGDKYKPKNAAEQQYDSVKNGTIRLDLFLLFVSLCVFWKH